MERQSNTNSSNQEEAESRKWTTPMTNIITNMTYKRTDRRQEIINAKSKKDRKIKSAFMGVFVGLITALGGFMYGYDTGMINGVIEMPYFKEHFTIGGKTYFSANEKAIVTSILSLGTFFGAILSSSISDKYGRKPCLTFSLLIFFNLGTILQICSQKYGLLLAGRFVNGLGVGVISSVIPLYQAEVSPRWLRGSIISFYQWAITWGLLASSAIAQGTRRINNPKCFRIPIGLQFLWTGIMMIGLYFIPESPRFFVMHNDLDGAIISLSKLGRLSIHDEELIEELIEIKASYDYEISGGNTSYMDCFRNARGRSKQLRRMLTGIAVQACQQSSGINFIFYYGVNFFVASGLNNSYLMSFLTYLVNSVCTIPGILLVDRVGRRRLLLIGAVGMSISNYIIAIVGVTVHTVAVNKVMIGFVCLFIAFFAATWGPVTWVVTGELYSLSVRQKAASICAGTNWIVNFAFAISTPYLVDSGSHTAALGTKIFFIWGSMNAFGFFFTLFFLYETKGLMLEEIDELYRVCPTSFQSKSFNKKIKDEGSSLMDDKDSPRGTMESDLEKTIPIDSVNTNVTNGTHATDISYTVQDYLQQWERKHQHRNILADNIINTQDDTLPESLIVDSDEGTSQDEVHESGGTGSQDEIDFNHEFGLYGELPPERSTGVISDEEYHQNLQETIEHLQGQSGIDMNLDRPQDS